MRDCVRDERLAAVAQSVAATKPATAACYRSAASTWRLSVKDLCEYIIVDLDPVKRDDRFAPHGATDIAVDGGRVIGYRPC